MRSAKRNGTEEFLCRLEERISGTYEEKTAYLTEVRNMLAEVPFSDGMSFEILCAAVGRPEDFAEAYEPMPKPHSRGRAAIVAVLCAACIAVPIIAGAFSGSREDSDVESYSLGEGLPEGELEHLQQYDPDNARLWSFRA